MKKKKQKLGSTKKFSLKKMILLFCVFLLFSFFGMKMTDMVKKERERKKEEVALVKQEKELVEAIKVAYHPRVKTTKQKQLYQKRDGVYQAVGTIGKGIVIPLKETKISSSKDGYFPLADENYYIDYQNIEEWKEKSTYDSFVATKEVTVNPTILYQGNTIAFVLDQDSTFDVLWEKEGTYYVEYLEEVYELRDPVTVTEKESEPLLTQLSVFSFSSSLSQETKEKFLSKFQELGYHSITKNQFDIWVHQEGSLPEKSLLFLGQEDQENDSLFGKYGFHLETNYNKEEFPLGDSQVKQNEEPYYAYDLTEKVTLHRLEEMLAGKKEVQEEENATEIAVLNYHFFYDSKIENCTESICLSIEKWREQLDYLRNQGYRTLTMQEFYDWKVGKIRLPKKSVLLTVDDGAAGTSTYLPQLLDEYEMHASLFLITGWWDIANYQKSKYLEIYSHGDELHHGDFCNERGCGYKPLLLSKEELITDLNTSFAKVENRLAFCYPFYQTSKTIEEALRETGVSLAFVGGNRKAKRTDNNYYLPRYVIYQSTSLSSFIGMIS